MLRPRKPVLYLVHLAVMRGQHLPLDILCPLTNEVQWGENDEAILLLLSLWQRPVPSGEVPIDYPHTSL